MKDKLIVIGDKTYMKSIVVMLPTEKESRIRGKKYYPQVHTYEDISFAEEGKIFLSMATTGESENLALYFLSDEGIKEGDYFINLGNHNTIVKADKDGNPLAKDYCKKIIATTDSSLTIKIKVREDHTDSIDFILPRPSDAFLQKYCELGGIDEVLIEVKIHTYGNIKDMKSDSLENYPYNERGVIKIAPDNTISIRQLEVKTSWNREEVEQLMFLSYNQRTMDNKVKSTQEFKDWISTKL